APVGSPAGAPAMAASRRVPDAFQRDSSEAMRIIPGWLTIGEVSSPVPAHPAIIPADGVGGGTYASTRARDRMGHGLLGGPGHHFTKSRRSDLGSRKPVPVLQADPLVCIA